MYDIPDAQVGMPAQAADAPGWAPGAGDEDEAGWPFDPTILVSLGLPTDAWSGAGHETIDVRRSPGRTALG